MRNNFHNLVIDGGHVETIELAPIGLRRGICVDMCVRILPPLRYHYYFQAPPTIRR